jgi:hypothetical protein
MVVVEGKVKFRGEVEFKRKMDGKSEGSVYLSLTLANKNITILYNK